MKITNWFDQKLPIFRNTFLKTVFSPTFIVVSIIYISTIVTTQLAILSLKSEVSNYSASLSVWLTVSFASLYFLIITIVFATRLYSDQIKNGIVKMELRAGKKISQIFFERFAALYIILFTILILSLIIEIITFQISRFSFTTWFYQVYLFKYLYLTIYIFMLLSFMILWLSFANQIVPILLSTFILMIIILNPFIGTLLQGENKIEGRTEKTQEINMTTNKAYFYQKYDKLVKDGNKYAKDISETFWELENSLVLAHNGEGFYNVGFDNLILDGFLLESETLIEDTLNNTKYQYFKFSEDFDKKNNGLYCFLEKISEISKSDSFDSQNLKNWENSRFNLWFSRKSEKHDYKSLSQKIKKQKSDKDLLAINELIFEFIETNMYFYSTSSLSDFYSKLYPEIITTTTNSDFFTKSNKTPGYFDYSKAISVLTYNYLVYEQEPLEKSDFEIYKSGMVKNISFSPGGQAHYLFGTPPNKYGYFSQAINADFFEEGLSRILVPTKKPGVLLEQEEVIFPKKSQWENYEIKEIEIVNYWGLLIWWITLPSIMLVLGYYIFKNRNWIN
ncbi:hypothetical protein [Spiroplasma endosymbiont of Panorpa germanica]|uniref:hypothetical protein n=1 Tax=Spiroplasma endosymbiont of Panorpa germanica TaxID=3066314 RepID=UPI0030CB2390